MIAGVKRLCGLVCLSLSLWSTQGCYSYEYSTDGAVSNDGTDFFVGGEADCFRGQEVMGFYDTVLDALSLYDAGAADWYSGNPVTIGICLSREPSSCANGNYILERHVGPNGLLQRVAGCYTQHSIRQIYVASVWPPVCRPAWPDEPHCVDSADHPSRKAYVEGERWKRALVDEFAKGYAIGRLLVKDEVEAVEKIYAPDGVATFLFKELGL